MALGLLQHSTFIYGPLMPYEEGNRALLTLAVEVDGVLQPLRLERTVAEDYS